MQFALVIIVGYLLGCIPSGLFVGRYFCNVDIRNYGSKNLGTTNMFRILGAKPALVVLLLDMTKGMLAVFFAMYLLNSEFANLLAAIAAIMGHNYPIFLGFKGGRGVATGLGVILVLMPKVTVVVFVLWAIIVCLTKYVSLASVIAAILVPILSFYFGYSYQYLGFSFIACLFIVLRHRENIQRLLSGTESKIKKGNMQQFKDEGGEK